ncbi:MAG: TonB family protein [Candidatus Eisenbacteria sp.]|nr:TonB family protein [Candidatus Eisenbacteria bacterium]
MSAARLAKKAPGSSASFWARASRALGGHLSRLVQIEPDCTRIHRRDRDWRRSLLASGIFHLACLMIFAFVPWRSDEMKWDVPPLVVSLVSLSEISPKTVTKQSCPQQKPRPKRKRDTPILKERPKKRPAKKEITEAPKQDPKTHRPPAQAQARTDTLAPLPTSHHQLKMAARVDEKTFDYDYYLPLLARKISEAWEPMGRGPGGNAPHVTLRVRIGRDGRVSSVDIEESSAVALFNRSALDAVWQAQPFPSLPRTYEGRWLTVHLRFTHTGEHATASR